MKWVHGEDHCPVPETVPLDSSNQVLRFLHGELDGFLDWFPEANWTTARQGWPALAATASGNGQVRSLEMNW